jgi:hypothetical protein
VRLLRECVERRPGLAHTGLASLFEDLGRAIDHLERTQGFSP